MNKIIRLARISAGIILFTAGFFAVYPKSLIVWGFGAMLFWAGMTGRCGFGATQCGISSEKKDKT